MVRIALVGVSAWGACGCATVVHGTRQAVTVTSDPPGAAVTLTFGIDALSGGAFKLPKAVHAAVCPK